MLSKERILEIARQNLLPGYEDDIEQFARAIERAATIAAMQKCAEICGVKFALREAGGFPREASTARSLRDEILAEIAKLEAEK